MLQRLLPREPAAELSRWALNYLSRIHSHRRSSMIIALASPCIASTLDEGLDKIKRFLSEASAQGAEIVCFPEAYLPGLRGQDFEVLPFAQTQQERVSQAGGHAARAAP